MATTEVKCEWCGEQTDGIEHKSCAIALEYRKIATSGPPASHPAPIFNTPLKVTPRGYDTRGRPVDACACGGRFRGAEDYRDHLPCPAVFPPDNIPIRLVRKADPFVLPTDSEERKGVPIFSGVLNYFPLAVAAVARVSKRGNDKHNPGQPLHWARGKSMDHEDCIARHLIDVETIDPVTGEYEDAMALAWRALAKLQELEERRLGKPPSRGSR